ncbi:MAG: FGGY family carbohydrate kinase, partial [Actinobacteria bacterium]|nr:FGGY family carbohydrate kinase [Actinomycetota bacterium]
MKNKNKNNEYLMAIDLGTSTVKVAIFNVNGSQAVYESTEYELSYPEKDYIENDVNKYWGCIVTLIKKSLGKLDDNPSRILA